MALHEQSFNGSDFTEAVAAVILLDSTAVPAVTGGLVIPPFPRRVSP
jgi:hypothetical protein